MDNKVEIDNEIDELISLNLPFILFGDVGKTFYLRNKFKNAVVVDSREIEDFKNLSGHYTFKCGEIEYNNGLLIESMQKGKILVIKRIDLNMNLFYFLYSVIKYRTIVNSLGEVFVAHKEFNLIFTSKEMFEFDFKFVGPLIFSYEKMFQQMNDVMKNCIKNLLSYVSKNKALKCLYSEQKRCGRLCLLRISECTNEGFLCMDTGKLCGIHFRDLMQLLNSVSTKIEKLTYDNRMIIYENFINLFLKHDSEEILTLLHLNQLPQTVLYEEDIGRTYPFLLGVRNIALNVKNKNHTLLIGETGSGKTSVVQYLARNSVKHFGTPTSLKIINMSSDFDGSDLVGGYCALDIKKKIRDVYNKYNLSRPNTFDSFVLLNHLKSHLEKMNSGDFEREVQEIEKCLQKKVNIVYKEGLLTESMKLGEWVLLDEINLCNEETLNLIEALVSKDKITHSDQTETQIHPSFRLFACMNPHGDHGKKKFDSYYFNHVIFHDFSTDIEDINTVIKTTMKEDWTNLGEYFFTLKSKIHSRELVNRLEPLLTGRTLVRALMSLNLNPEIDRSEILSCLFLTQFNLQSKIIARNLMSHYFHVKQHTLKKTHVDLGFILTPKVQMQVQDILMATKLNYPILIQGDTSTGKTSIIYYLASKTNKNVLRINNHEHTESSDYLGTYVTTRTGIEFKEGAFIKALRKGDWVILDELNLAPSDVLEVLNRLLDDNREIYIPQIDEIVKPHLEFRIFATQNLEYSGRKGLSKAFRNRFIEIFFEEKEDKEVFEILQLKTGLPVSFCKKMVNVYTLLKHQRNVSYLMTLRDLFRWASRVPRTIYEVFETGMSILYERQRSKEDKDKVFSIFKNVFSDCMGVENFDFVYKENSCFDLKITPEIASLQGIVVTKSVKKLLTLLYASIKCSETTLIVGETGIGKTKIVNVISESIGNKLTTLNMHSGSESSDFIGSFALKDDVISWKNGVLVDAMTSGHSFLIDEVNLAEDSVLERLNSLFEASGEIFITEIERSIKAHKKFRLFATMNPGNDFGKRELSPALRNRFTEIYYELDDEEIFEIFKAVLNRKACVSPSLMNRVYKGVFVGKSLRRHEVLLEFLSAAHSNEQSLVKIDSRTTEEEIVDEALSLVDSNAIESAIIDDKDKNLGVYPFYVSRREEATFNFFTATTKINLKRILRAMILKKGILLEGEPGVGKTSIVSNLARVMSKKCIRINLSEQTELSDLVGTYIPTERGIEFVPSELTRGLMNGDFIVLDEINLCTQSVIEGLNSVLDFRRTLFLPEMTVVVHPETKIFATMNPSNSTNGRKILPRSFRDRFVVMYMSPYTEDDIKQIISHAFPEPKFYPKCSLRENLKRNVLKDFSKDKEKSYEVSASTITIGCLRNHPIRSIPDWYTIVHSQIKSLEEFVMSVINDLPVILSKGVGRGAMVRFVCEILGLRQFDFICNKEIDTSDLLGQYHKVDSGEFMWKDSGLVEALRSGCVIVIHNPELVEKSIFDRLNSIFEREKSLNVYEKGIDSCVEIHPDSRLILLSKNPLFLSPALLDRCIHIELSSRLDSVDLWKIFCKSRVALEKLIFRNGHFGQVKRTKADECRIVMEEWVKTSDVDLRQLDLHLRRFDVFGTRPSILTQDYSGVYNMLLEEEIESTFAYRAEEVFFDKQNIGFLDIYKRFVFEIPCGTTEIEKIGNIEKCASLGLIERSLVFLKNVKSFTLSGRTPRDLNGMKKSLILSLKDRTFKDYRHTREMAERLGRVDFETTWDFDMSYFEMLANLDDDPLEIYRNFLKFEKTRKENKLQEKIYREIKNIYKYGEGCVGSLIDELNEMSTKFDLEIQRVEAKLPRNYALFKRRFMEVTFEKYKEDLEIQQFFEGFSDVFDYYLLYLAQVDPQKGHKWVDFISSLAIPTFNAPISCSYESLCVYFMNFKDLNALKNIPIGRLGRSLSHFLFSLMCGSVVIEPSSLVMEAVCSEMDFDLEKAVGLQFDARLLNECLLTVFKPKKVGYIIEQRREVTVDSPIGVSPMIETLPMCSTPLEVLYKVERDLSGSTNLISYDELECKLREIDISETHKELKRLRADLLKYFETSLSCTWLMNFRYFPYLFCHGLVDGERYFLDSLVYEFYDKIKIAGSLALQNTDNFFYNTVLQYKAFEIEDAVEKKVKDSQSKLRKDAKLCKKIHEDLRNYLTLPVTKVLSVEFERPGCSCDEKKANVYSFLLREKGAMNKCDCEEWLCLADTFDRKDIENQLKKVEEVTRPLIVAKFYGRTPGDKFSYKEICLSKVINRLTDDPTHLKLVDACLKEASPAFLYFVFQFSEDKENVEYEDGLGIKGGTGEKNISDQIKEEEEISNEYDDEKCGEEEDGVDFDNQGSISTCDEEEASETGVEGDEESVEEGVEESKDEDGNDEDQREEDDGNDIDNNNEVDSLEDKGDFCDENASEGKEDSSGDLDEARDNDDVSPLGYQSDYVFKEQQLNNNQTCDQAEDYDRRVFGDNQDEEALCEGEGDQQAVGNDETGDPFHKPSTVNFNYKDSFSNTLTLLLRTIFESNRYNKYKGDYKSGKKLNMKKIIPYIASDYRKDKIWMKRRKSEKKDYVVRLFVDNSRSMYSQSMIDTLFVTFSRLTNSFKTLGIPVEIYRFGNDLVECSLEEMNFTDTETNIDWIDQFRDGINIVLTDGVFQKTSFYNNNFLVILIDRSGIKKMSKVSLCDGNVFVQNYLDQFQLKYCTIENVEELENVFIVALSDLIRSVIE